MSTQIGYLLNRDFHTLTTTEVEMILEAAKQAKYRKPANANGSRARYFHTKLQREALRSRSAN